MCGCSQGSTPASEPSFEVRLPNGETKVVQGEHAAKVEITVAGGGTYSLIR
jgi:hypothetical protein